MVSYTVAAGVSSTLSGICQPGGMVEYPGLSELTSEA